MITMINVEGGSGNIPSGPMQFKNDWCGVFLRGDYLDGLLQEIFHLKDLDSTFAHTPKIQDFVSFQREAHSMAGMKPSADVILSKIIQATQNSSRDSLSSEIMDILEAGGLM